jgi:hypothetical protein
MPTFGSAEEMYNDIWFIGISKTPERTDLINKTIINFKAPDKYSYSLISLNEYFENLLRLQYLFTIRVLKGEVEGIEKIINSLRNEKLVLSQQIQKLTSDAKQYPNSSQNYLKKIELMKLAISDIDDNLIPILTSGVKLAEKQALRSKFKPEDAYYKGFNDAKQEGKPMDSKILAYSGTELDYYAEEYQKGFTEMRQRQADRGARVQDRMNRNPSTSKSLFGKGKKHGTKKKTMHKTRKHVRK